MNDFTTSVMNHYGKGKKVIRDYTDSPIEMKVGLGNGRVINIKVGLIITGYSTADIIYSEQSPTGTIAIGSVKNKYFINGETYDFSDEDDPSNIVAEKIAAIFDRYAERECLLQEEDEIIM